MSQLAPIVLTEEQAQAALDQLNAGPPTTRLVESGDLFKVLVTWNLAAVALERIRSEQSGDLSTIQRTERGVRYLEAQRAAEAAHSAFEDARWAYVRGRTEDTTS